MPADRFVPPEEICKHGDRQSCWIVIEDNVYDVTDFLDSHPGGAAAILRYAGRVCQTQDRVKCLQADRATGCHGRVQSNSSTRHDREDASCR